MELAGVQQRAGNEGSHCLGKVEGGSFTEDLFSAKHGYLHHLFQTSHHFYELELWFLWSTFYP